MVRNKKVVFTNGCFDILHIGHVLYLNEAKALGDKLVVGLNSDRSVRSLKGPERPINNEKDRKFILENLKSVDEVIIFDDSTPIDLIKKVRPDILVKGGDWPIDKIVGHDFVQSRGGQVLSLAFKEGYSTTGTLEKIKSL